MRKLVLIVWSLFIPVALLAAPASAMATAGFDYGVVHDYCGSTNDWTNYYKVRETSADTTNANRLTIDSWAQTKYFMAVHPHWVTVKNWPQASTSFAIDHTYHHLTVKRSWNGGGIEQASRIVMRLRAWHNGTLLWSMNVHSTPC